ARRARGTGGGCNGRPAGSRASNPTGSSRQPAHSRTSAASAAWRPWRRRLRRGAPGGGPRGAGGGGGGGPAPPPPSPAPRRPPARPPRRPPPPPPPSKDALPGNVPLRTFGQLKQLFEERGKEDEPANTGAGEPASPPSSTPPAPAPTAEGESPTPEAVAPPE